MAALWFGAVLIVAGWVGSKFLDTRAGGRLMHDLLPCDEPDCCDFPRSNLRLVSGGRR